MPNGDYEKWDEFEWERELRREDARVNAYLEELPGLIDLPGETEMMRKRLERHPELVPESAFFSDFDWSDEDDEDNDEDKAFYEEWKTRPGADLYFQLALLASKCCAALAAVPVRSGLPEGPLAIGLYGRLMCWTLDMADLSKNELPAFRLALCKRLLSGINQLVSVLNDIAAKLPARREELAGHVEGLHKVRDRVVDMLSALRQEKT